jgi:2-dehydro-3-deoxyphosphogluconate aldolase/(4S)-4-hydroxy-2-oxoglutarate aldolase
VKLFPARLVGPAYVADLLKPLAEAPLLWMGGVTAANVGEFLAAGAVAAGISFGESTTEAEARRVVEAVASAGAGGERKERS